MCPRLSYSRPSILCTLHTSSPRRIVETSCSRLCMLSRRRRRSMADLGAFISILHYRVMSKSYILLTLRRSRWNKSPGFARLL